MSKFRSWVLCLVSFAVALAVTITFWNDVFETIPFACFFAAIAFSAWRQGFDGGILVTALSGVSVSILFWRESGAVPVLPISILLGVSACVCALAEMRLRALSLQQKEAARCQRLADELQQVKEGLEIRVKEQTEELRKSEQKFRLLVHSVQDYAIFMLDENGHVRSWNIGAERITGFSAAEILGQHFSKFFTADEIKEGMPEREIQQAKETGRTEVERWQVRKDGSQFWANVVMTPIRDAEGKLVGYTKISRDITERRKAEEARAALAREKIARGEAEKANKLKDEFLSIVSHELRTPLTPILGWTRMLRAFGDGNARLQQGVNVIERNVRTQIKIIEDLLDISRIVSGKIKLDFKATPLSPLLEAAIESVKPNAEPKRIYLRFTDDEYGETVFGDPDRLKQVIWNLLNNAVKFTPVNGRIDVKLRRINGNAEIEVTDNGEGISAEYLPRIFDRFSQFDSTSSRKHGGLGLGLAIARQMVELHGGSIEAYSAGLGKGATFTVTLPLITSESEIQSHAHGSFAPAQVLKNRRILVVEDEPDALEMLKIGLEQYGASVSTALSAKEAIEIASKVKPDLLISDIGMPELDGYALIRHLRQEGFVMPAIALTAFARDEDKARALSEGFQKHVPKPVDIGELCAIINESLQIACR